MPNNNPKIRLFIISHYDENISISFSVVLGEHDITKQKDCDNCSQSVRQVQETIIHESYDPVHLTGHYDDIALLHLKSGAKQSSKLKQRKNRISFLLLFSGYIRPICLNRDTDYSSTEYTLSGWGKTENGTLFFIC